MVSPEGEFGIRKIRRADLADFVENNPYEGGHFFELPPFMN